jgi:hypothetical protein
MMEAAQSARFRFEDLGWLALEGQLALFDQLSTAMSYSAAMAATLPASAPPIAPSMPPVRKALGTRAADSWSAAIHYPPLTHRATDGNTAGIKNDATSSTKMIIVMMTALRLTGTLVWPAAFWRARRARPKGRSTAITTSGPTK